MNGLVFFLFGMAAGYWLKCVKDNWMRMRDEGERHRNKVSVERHSNKVTE